MYRCVWSVFCLSLEKNVDVARRRQSSYDVARLHLAAPIDFWRNSIPFFGAVALCTMEIDDFRKRPQKSKYTENDQPPLIKATRDIDKYFRGGQHILYIRIEINKGRVQGNKMGQKKLPLASPVPATCRLVIKTNTQIHKLGN